jgi:hypothetical protein
LIVVQATGTAHPTNYAKREVARKMYFQGKAFLVAAAHVRGASSTEEWNYVSLHLVCQGIELIMKALLLLSKYDEFLPKLIKLGHRLEAIWNSVSAEYSISPLLPKERKQLAALAKFYTGDQLRYAGMQNFFINPQTIDSEAIIHRLSEVEAIANTRFSEA